MGRAPAKPNLQFSEALAKAAVGDLVRRLQVLHKELAAFEQGEVDVASLNNVSRELLGKNLLMSKDRSVRAYTTCCIADMLRLFAPDAPYTGPELKDIFEFFMNELKHCTNQNAPNYTEYVYLLTSLANVKSAVLICEVPSAEKLIIKTFRTFVDLAKPELGKKDVLLLLSDILAQLIDEAVAVPQDVIDIILAQFLPKNVRANPTALQLVVDTCTVTTEKLQRYVAQYFTDVILNAVPEGEDDMSEDDDAPGPSSRRRGRKGTQVSSVADSQDFITAHELIKSINRHCPSLLTNVVPQLEEELTAEDTGVRELAVRTLGEMFADKPLEKAGSLLAMMKVPTRSNLVQKYPNTWRAWLGRARDKMPNVRLAVLASFKDILATHHELGKDIYETLSQKIIDPEEKIRQAACAAFSSVDYETAVHFMDERLLRTLAGRIQDKKHSVQKEALTSLARLYDHAYGEIANGEAVAIERFSWIPQEILKASALPDVELRAGVEKALLDYILPLPEKADEEEQWADRFLLVMHFLEEQYQKALLKLSRLQPESQKMFTAYIDICEKFNGGTVDADEDEEIVTGQLKTICRFLASVFPDSAKAEQDLGKFARINEPRLYKLLRTLMDPQSDLKTIISAHTEALKRIHAASSSIVETFTLFIRRSSLLIINRSTIAWLLNKFKGASEEQEDGEGEAMAESLASISKSTLETIDKSRPELFAAHQAELTRILLNESDERLLEVSLRALSQLARCNTDLFARDRHVLDRAHRLVLDGTPTQAKFAATLVAKAPDNIEQTADLVQDIADALGASSGIRLVSYLSALKRLAKDAANVLEPHMDAMIPVLKKVLMRDPAAIDEDEKDNEEEVAQDRWSPPEELPYDLQACLLVLKIFTNRCLAYADQPNAESVAGQTVKMAGIIVSHFGEPPKFKKGPGFAGPFRLTAAVSLLRLATKPKYDRLVMTQFRELAGVIQDMAYQVRGAFIHKLVTYIFLRKFPSNRYLTLLFLTAHDPDPENMTMARQLIIERVQKSPPETRMQQFDMLLLRLLHLLAHHPDFGREVEELKAFVRYIEFFLDCICTKENVSLLFYLAQKLKSVQDKESSSENLYIISELTEYIIKSRAQREGWTLEPHPAHIQMPKDIFRPLPSQEVLAEIHRNTYLSQETIEQLGTVGKNVKSELEKRPRKPKATNEKKRKANSTEVDRKPKKVASKGKSNSTHGTKKSIAAKKRGAEWQSDTEDEDPESTGDDSENEDLQAYKDELAAKKRTGPTAAAKRKTSNGDAGDESDEDRTIDDDEDGEDDDVEEVTRPSASTARPSNLRQRPKATPAIRSTAPQPRKASPVKKANTTKSPSAAAGNGKARGRTAVQKSEDVEDESELSEV